ncbi:MAG: glycosyltransferase family 4 protein [bacterium]
MKISFIRGAYLNNFEGQNYPSGITGYSSLIPIDSHVSFPVIKLPSLADLQTISFLNKPIKYITNRTLGDSQILWGLEQYIAGSDIAHVADPHYYYSYQAARLRAKGDIKKLISTWWETIPFNNESTEAKKKIKHFTMKNVDHFICHCEKAKQCLIAEGIAKDATSLIPLGVDTTVFYPSIKKDTKNFTILFVGRLVEEKGILDLYEAFKQVIGHEKFILLKIVGSGPLKNKLQSAIQKDGLQKIVEIDHKSYEDMPKIFRQADVVCVPSKKTVTWEEQYGMVFVEAMASGIPIVSYTTGAIPNVVHNCGLLTNEGNIKQLGVLLKKLYSDRQLRLKIGTMGRERAKELFDSKKAAQAIEKLYKLL